MEEEKEKSLIEAIEKLRETIEKLYSQKELVITNPKKFLFYNFLSGFFRAIGSVLGATVFLTLIIWFISKLELVPIFGNWIISVLDYIKKSGFFIEK